MAAKAADIVTRVLNNNVFVDVCLISSFLALGVRSLNQQRDIETLEAQKSSLLQSNKVLKILIWDSKQKLFSEASSPETAIIPLSKLKVIYGEVVSVPAGGDDKKDGKTPTSKLLI